MLEIETQFLDPTRAHIEGVAPVAMPLEGATRAPVIEDHDA